MTDRPTRPEVDPSGDGIEITPEMIEAGVREFCAYDPRFENPREVVVEIWKAMFAVSPKA